VTGNHARGTLWGEMAESFMQFKSFGFSFTTLQLEAMQQILAREGWKNVGAYFASLVIPLTLGGAVAMQIKHLLQGKDLEDMTSPQFWLRAGVQGGGFGIIGDFLQDATNRFGGGVVETLIGPAPAFIGDVVNTGFAAVGQMTGAKRNTGREAIKLAQRYTPILSSHWATRGAYRHLILDQLQFLTDPEAHQAFKAQMSRAKNQGQDYWWRPGETMPRRASKMF